MNKILIFFICFTSTNVSVLAQTTLKIWERTALFTTKQKWSELTTYLPSQENNTGISIIICPGGSYCYLGMKKEGHQIARYLQSKGIAAFVLRYRVGLYGNEHPAMIQDLQRAVQLVKEMSGETGIDPDKVGVMGFSAGGHLVGTAATYFDVNFMEPLGIVPDVSLKPAFVAMIYPVVSMTDENIVHKRSRRNLLGKSNKTKAMENYLSLEKNVREDMPPIFLMHCTGDKKVDYRNSEYYAEALSAKKVKHKYLLFDEKGHGFGIKPNGKATGWQEHFISWLLDEYNIKINERR
ncbi:MAG: alpha/beta hydrolase [Prevotellaceae bacterium]|nr:alpha/beta hydrolase [Prevotellaceae bacterium]